MRGSREVGTWDPDDSLPHGQAQSCKFPQEYWFGTFGKATDVGSLSLVGRRWPVLVNGYKLIY